MWDKRYTGDEYIYGIEPNEFLRAQFTALPIGDTLCLAEGEGRNAVFLASKGHRVTAVDSSAVGLAKARELAKANGESIEVQTVDLANYDLGKNRWDAIVSIFAHVPPPIRQRAHAQIEKALRPGGRLLLEAYTPAQVGNGTGGPPVAELMMDLDSLKAELSGLRFDHAVELDREVMEGVGHTGVGSVVQLIATKLD